MNLYGGARQVVWLLRGLSDAGVDNVLMCPTGSAIAAAEFPNRVSVIATRMRGDHDVGFIGRALRQIRHSRPDLVHLHSRRGADWFGGIAAPEMGSVSPHPTSPWSVSTLTSRASRVLDKGTETEAPDGRLSL